MRLAVISDIHGNLPALEAVLGDIARQGVDLTLCAGDVVNPFPGSMAALHLLHAAGVPIVAGNHETYLADFDRPGAPAAWRSIPFGPLQWCHRQLTPADFSLIAALPLTLNLDPAGVLLCHGTPQRNDRHLLQASEMELAGLLAGQPARLILCGHGHTQAERRWQGRQLVRVGSVGLPLDGDPRAQYTVVQRNGAAWNVERRAVAYDRELTLGRVEASGLLGEGGPLAWLFFAELITARPYLVPFFHWLGDRKPADLPAWEAEVETYLRLRGNRIDVGQFRGKYRLL